MDERRLTSLLGMAREAESLERDLLGAAVRHPRGRVARGRRWVRVAAQAGLLGCVVVAAVIAIVLVGRPKPAGMPALAGKGAEHRGATVEPAAEKVAEPSCENMLIALYRDDEQPESACAECWCVQRWSPEWAPGVDATAVGSEQAIGASLDRACVALPTRLVVIGLTGPAGSLPASDEQAREMALCIVDERGAVKPDARTSAASCVASAVDFRVHTWSR